MRRKRSAPQIADRINDNKDLSLGAGLKHFWKSMLETLLEIVGNVPTDKHL